MRFESLLLLNHSATLNSQVQVPDNIEIKTVAKSNMNSTALGT